jgi:alpha-tubulin suppressor-like RCC1 family protein
MDGRVCTGGTPSYGNLAMGDNQFIHARLLPVSFLELGVGPIQEVHHAGYSTHVLTTAGAVWGWGYNGQGQVGDNTHTTPRYSPRRLYWGGAPAPVITRLASTGGGTLNSDLAWYALDAQGNVWSWGYNGHGQLALGDTSSTYYYPRQTSLTGVVDITASGGQQGTVFAITATGDVYTAGASGNGQNGLGIGNVHMWTQVPLPGPCSKVCSTAVGNVGHTLFLLTDGSVYGVGNSGYGQVGAGGSEINYDGAPVHVATIANVVDIWVGGGRYGCSYASLANGDFYCWGFNGQGQLGLNNAYSSPALPMPHLLNDIVAVALGTSSSTTEDYNHSVLLDAQGRAYAAGYNGYGQCGSGIYGGNQPTHELIQLPDGVQGTITQIQTMGYYTEQGTALLDSNGHVWVCGYGGGHMLCATPSNTGSLALPVRVFI